MGRRPKGRHVAPVLDGPLPTLVGHLNDFKPGDRRHIAEERQIDFAGKKADRSVAKGESESAVMQASPVTQAGCVGSRCRWRLRRFRSRACRVRAWAVADDRLYEANEYAQNVR